MNIEFDITLPEQLFRGDSIDLDCHVNIDLTDYKIRCEIFDQFCSSIKLATINVTAGSDSQIDITDAANGTFSIYIEKVTTSNFHVISFIEIELEDDNGKIYTVFYRPLTFVNKFYNGHG